jgi:hypothetical protein
MYIHETGVPRCVIYIYCNLFIHVHTLQYIHSSTYIAIYSFIHLFDRSKEGFWRIHLGVPVADSFIYSIDQKKVFGEFTSVCQWRRFPCACGRAAAVTEEEAGSSGRGGQLERRRRQRRRSVE